MENFLRGNWDEKHAVAFRYPVYADATLGRGELFYDLPRLAQKTRLMALR
jgi:hypothetical protein